MTHVRSGSWIAIALLSTAACAAEPRPRPRAPAAPEARDDHAAPGVQPARGPERAVLLALRRVHFALDDASLPEPSRQALAEAAQHLRDLDVTLTIEGHADERGASDYNLALGQRRSEAVTEYLTHLGIARSRLETISYGEERPLAEGSGQEAWAANRRVDFRLLRGQVQLVLEEGVRLGDRGTPIGAR